LSSSARGTPAEARIERVGRRRSRRTERGRRGEKDGLTFFQINFINVDEVAGCLIIADELAVEIQTYRESKIRLDQFEARSNRKHQLGAHVEEVNLAGNRCGVCQDTAD
jgi:hypothetical protein